eukprot:COSAG01_NODE_214_length_21729_cov_684.831623_15_plen_41_part_00
MLSLLLLCDLDTRACHTATTTTSAPLLPLLLRVICPSILS